MHEGKSRVTQPERPGNTAHKHQFWRGRRALGCRAYVKAVPEEPAVPAGRRPGLPLPPRDDVRDAHRQRVCGPAEAQRCGAGVNDHDEVALYLLQASTRRGAAVGACA